MGEISLRHFCLLKAVKDKGELNYQCISIFMSSRGRRTLFSETVQKYPAEMSRVCCILHKLV